MTRQYETNGTEMNAKPRYDKSHVSRYFLILLKGKMIDDAFLRNTVNLEQLILATFIVLRWF